VDNIKLAEPGRYRVEALVLTGTTGPGYADRATEGRSSSADDRRRPSDVKPLRAVDAVAG
jgi:hypothetical protein